MRKLKVNVLEKEEKLSVFGLWVNSNDKNVSKDIKAISKQYYQIVAKKGRDALPFFVLCKDYNEKTKDFKLFVGGSIENSQLQEFVLSAGYYGIVTVKPKLGFIWGIPIGEAKRHFYTQWLPKSDYQALDLEYEYHTEKSVSKSPEIEIYFAIDKKSNIDT